MPRNAEHNVVNRSMNHVGDSNLGGSPAGEKPDGPTISPNLNTENLDVTIPPAPTCLEDPHRISGTLLIDPVTCDITSIPGDHLVRRSVGHNLPMIEIDSPVGKRGRHIQIVGNQNHGHTPAAHSRQTVKTPGDEAFVSDRQHLVNQKNIRINCNGDGEAQPNIHSRRVGLDRLVDKVANTGEFKDVIHPLLDLPAG